MPSRSKSSAQPEDEEMLGGSGGEDSEDSKSKDSDTDSKASSASDSKSDDEKDVACDSDKLTCQFCTQEFGKPDRDAPEDKECDVEALKVGSEICKACHYIHKGCFTGKGNEKTHLRSDMLIALRSHKPVKKVFLKLRKGKVVAKCTNPKAKPRHFKQNVADLIRRSEEQYVDFQSVSRLWP